MLPIKPSIGSLGGQEIVVRGFTHLSPTW